MSICSISVSPKYILLKKGENYLNQTVKVDGDTTTSCLEWCSADPSIAGVHPDSGRILANGVGKTKVYVNSIFDTTKKDYIEVEVTDGEINVQSIELSTTSVTLEKGENFAITATVSPYNATDKSINWSSSNTNVATVSNGVVTAKAKGWTFIYARANDCSEVEAMCFVEVTEDVLVTSVTVSWSKDEVILNKNLTVGKVAYASKTVCPCDATDKTVTWSSDDESVAIVNPDSGLVTAKAVGEATIRATAKDGSGVYGECTITVVPPIHVTGIRTCTNKCLNVGEIECLCTTVLPENATNKTVRYSSSNPNVATVELFTGIITGKKAGTTTITATTDDGGFTACCEVKVGYSTSFDGRKITVCSEDDELLDNYDDEQITGLYVYANDKLLTTAREESNGDITVCMGEIVDALCTDYFLNPTFTEWYVATSHKDLKIFREKTYKTSELGLCPIDNINDRISLARFVEDMGYTSKYSSISYCNGSKIIIIQGHDWYSAANISSLLAENLLSITLSCLPYVGDAKDGIEGIVGNDIITGEPLTAFDRIMCIGCTFIPVMNGAVVKVGRKGLTKIDNVIECVDTLSDVQKAALRSDIWNILKPITRGLWIESEFARSVYKVALGWYHVGDKLNGFFPVIDFVKSAAKIEDVVVVSMKTLDPRLYKLANGDYNLVKIKNVINSYIAKLDTVDIFIDGVPISKSQRQLDLIVPKGYIDVIKKIEGINSGEIFYNLMEI